MWGAIFGCHLFPRSGDDEATADRNHLARMVALDFFNEDGSAKGEVPDETLESLLASSMERALVPIADAECVEFLAFIRRTLTWLPETRATAYELLRDPWFARHGIVVK